MKWSWKIGEVAGIGIYVHATFVILIAWLAMSHWLAERNVAMVLAGVGFILALFGCVLLHELGHALAAKRYGIKTRDITLLPIGGLARLERMPDDPKQELVVALAGPAVNVVIAAVLAVVMSLTSTFVPAENVGIVEGPFLQRLLTVNIILVLFNLLPAFPMDGGRVLRALLAMRMEYTTATHVAASIGQAMAFLFGMIGLFFNPFLLFIALFVWIGAAQEASMVQMKTALGGIPVSRAMLTDFKTVSPHDSLRDVIELTLTGSQKDFPVVENGKVVGILTQGDLLAALARRGSDVPVAEVMQRDVHSADSHDMLENVLAELEHDKCHTLPVIHNGELVGLMTMDNVGEFLRIQAALESRKTRKELV
ncbi:MAG: protease [Gemmatales bacterium]|nr:MAG: protease [Gemmatales bacterium]